MLSEMSAVRKRRRGCSSVSAAPVTPLKSRIPDCSPFPSFPTAFGQQKAALPLAITTLVLSTVALGIGDYIAYACRYIRHKEPRFEPAPDPMLIR